MLMPSIFGENLFDDWMDFPFEREFFGKNPLYGKNAKNIMKTDVRELDDRYELDIDLPGFKKDEITAELKDGYLVISAAKGLDKDEKDKEGRMIRQERYAGSCSRSFYVGAVSYTHLDVYKRQRPHPRTGEAEVRSSPGRNGASAENGPGGQS